MFVSWVDRDVTRDVLVTTCIAEAFATWPIELPPRAVHRSGNLAPEVHDACVREDGSFVTRAAHVVSVGRVGTDACMELPPAFRFGWEGGGDGRTRWKA